MEDLHSKYQKEEGTRELEPLRRPGAVAPITVSTEIASAIPHEYIKSEGTREVQTFLVIFSGGERRERDYFSLIERNRDKFPRVKIEFLDKSEEVIPNVNEKLAIKKGESGFSPDKLLIFAQHWINERYIKVEGSTNLIDSIYLLSDVDHFINELKRIKLTCEANDLKLIISNSCFEKWLYYGYYSEKPDENTYCSFSCPQDTIKISSAFKTYGNMVVSGGFKTKEALFQLEVAISNAKASYKEDVDGIPVLYSTNMFLLGEELSPLIKCELENLKRELEAKAESSRNRGNRTENI